MNEGFTLIEVLIVLIILGVLAAIVVLAVGHTRDDALNAGCVTDVKTIQLAEEAYTVHNHGYATSSDDLTAAGSGNLKVWPGSATLTFTLGGPSAGHPGYTLEVGGDSVAGGTLDPKSSDEIDDACAAA